MAVSKSLKVAYFVGTYPAVSESWLIEQTIPLLERGIKVGIFAFRRGDPRHVSDKIRQYGLMDNVVYLDFPENKFIRFFRAVPLILRVLLLKPTALSRIFNLSKYKAGAWSLKNLFWAAPVIGRLNKFNVIHCHFGMTANRFLTIQELLGDKHHFVTSIYGQDSKKYIQNKGEKVYDNMKEACDYFLLLTEEMKERFIRLGFPLEKLYVHYSGINPQYYIFNERQYNAGEVFNIILVGRFVEKKGIDDAIRAVAIVRENFPQIRFLIVGDGQPDYRSYLINLIKELGLEDVVVLKGILPHAETLKLYSEPSTHLMLQPSRVGSDGDTDDMPFVIVEAQMCGLPSVTTDHAGIREGIIDGETGFMVPERDYHALAQKILFLIRNPQVLAAMGRKGREFVTNKFGINHITDNLIKIYEEVSRR